MLERLRKLIFKADEDIEQTLRNVSSYLVDYRSTRYETLFRVIRRLSTQATDTSTTSTSLDMFSKLLTSVRVERDRLDRYRLIRELLQRLPELGQALQTYVDNVLSPDDYLKESLTIHTDDSEMRILVRELLDKYEIEDQLNVIVAKTLAFGDFFVEIREADPLVSLSDADVLVFDKEGNTQLTTLKEAFYPVRETDNNDSEMKFRFLVFWEPDNVVPIIYKNSVICFVVVKPLGRTTTSASPMSGTNSSNEPVINDFVSKIISFVSTKDPRVVNAIRENPQLHVDLATLVSNYLLDKTLNENSVYVVMPEKMEYFRLPSAVHYPYGESIFAHILTAARNLGISELAMLIYRLTRAPERRIFKVEVGGDRNVTNYIQQVIRKTKQKEVYLQNPLSIDLLVSEMSFFEDYYVPVKDGKEFFTVDTTPSGDLAARIDDIEYQRKKVISGTGIPPIYLIQEDTSESKYTLSQENVKFARTIVRLQKVFSARLTSLVRKLGALTFPDKASRLQTVTLAFRPPLQIQLAVLQEIFTSVGEIVNALSELLPDVEKSKLVEKYLSSFVSTDEIQEWKRTTKIDSLLGKKPSGGGEATKGGEEEVTF